MSLLSVHKLSKAYPLANGRLAHALNDVSFSIGKGEVLGVVGESGCGKSTLGRTLLRLTEADAGRVVYADQDLSRMSQQQLKRLRRECQIIFQDPFGSLNPRHSVGRIIAEPLLVHRVGNSKSRAQKVQQLLALVGLPEDSAARLPHEFSGGQRQRIAIARAIALEPGFIVADEAVSALDVSVQSQIINLIVSLQSRLGLSMLFISHDLSVVRHVSNRIAVMYLGRIVEIGASENIMQNPQHPYTQALISAIPHPMNSQQNRIVLSGELPDPANPPGGCAFHGRCAQATAKCRQQRPQLRPRLHPRLHPRLQPRLSRDAHDNNNQIIREIACHLYAEK